MDIQILSRMLLELLQDHERVGLPGLGAFVTEEVPAYFSDKGFTINPPYKKLSFRMYREDDGLLATLYSKANGISVEDASEVISTFCAEVRGMLIAERAIALPGLGKLKATKGNDFFFVPEEDLSIFAEEVGLEPISLKSHNEIPDQVRNDYKEVRNDYSGGKAVDESLKKTLKEGASSFVPDIAHTSKEKEEIPDQVRNDSKKEKEEIPGQARNDSKNRNDSKKKSRKGWKVLGWILLIAAVLCGAFVLASRLAPGSTDFLLYTPEELEILNY